MANNSYTYREFKRTIDGCSQSKIKQEMIIDYLRTDAALFDRYFEKLRFELSVQEQRQKLEAIQAQEAAEEQASI